MAAIAWAMARPGGDLVMPEVNGRPFIQEPPLAHWLAAASLRLFPGEAARDWAPRLPSMAFALGTLLVLGLRARRRLGRQGGLLAMAILASTAEFLEVANRAGTDAALVFFVTVGALAVLDLAREPAPSLRGAVVPGMVLGAAAGLSFLSKNLLGPAYLALVLGGVVLSRPRLLRSRAFWTRSALALLVFAALALPWPVALGLRDPEHLRTLLVENILGRFAGQGTHNPSLLEFAPRLLLDGLPWTPLFVLSAAWLVRRGLRSGEEGSGDDPFPGREEARALLAWIVFPTLVVLLSGSKRNLYLLSIYPGLALGLAAFLVEVGERRAAARTAAGAIILLAPVVPAAALLGALWVEALPPALFAATAVHLYLLYLWIRRRGWRSARASVAAAALLLSLAVVSGNLLRLRHRDARDSYVPLAEALHDLRGRGFRVAGYRLGLREESAVVYYLRDRVENLADPAPAAALLDPDGPPAALVARSRDLEDLPSALREAPGRASFPVSRGMEVLWNRAGGAGAAPGSQ